MNRRQRISSWLAGMVCDGLTAMRPGLADGFSTWWREQVGLHPNWCGPLEQRSAYYDRMFATRNEYRLHYKDSEYYPVWLEIMSRIERHGIKAILEIGCGSGQFASCALDSGVNSYVGLDFSAKAVEMARKAEPRGRFVVGDARSSDVYDVESYDAIICTEVLEHVVEDSQIVARFPSGKRCLCTVPNFADVAHVRHFLDVREVEERYGPFFTELSVTANRVVGSETAILFLIDGVRT